jgi:hypothetical protein
MLPHMVVNSEPQLPEMPAQEQDQFDLPMPLERRRKRGGPRWWRRLRKRLDLRTQIARLLLLLVGVASVVAVVALVLVTDTTSRVQSSLQGLERSLSGFSGPMNAELGLGDFERLQSTVRDLTSTLTSAQSQLNLVRPAAALDPNWEASLVSLEAAQRLSQAATTMLDGLQPTVFFLTSGEDSETLLAQISSGERVVELLRIGRGSFIDAQGYLQAAALKTESLTTAGLSPDTLLMVERLRNYQTQLTSINELLINAPDLLNAGLGLNSEQSYLILAQNSDEIRPSGGYISTYGWISVRNGRIIDYDYRATTTTTPNPPPDEFGSEMAIPSWWIRYREPVYAAWDGSWYADFPSTASMALRYYNEGSNPQSPVSGVIAIDIQAFEYILSALGEVVVPGSGDVVTTDNFRDVIYTIRADGRDQQAHKEFLAELYQQIFADWQTFATDPEVSARMFSVLLRALQEKHIMLYFEDEGLNRAVELMGWSGEQTGAAGSDYLMVVDANLGNKSNRSVRRQITYDVQIQADGTLSNRATIAYDYSAIVASADPAVNEAAHGPLDYDNLLQVFTTPDSVVTTTNEALPYMLQIVQPEHSLFVSQVQIPFDSSQRYQFAFTTPPLIERIGDYYRYRLLLQKQPGMQPELLSVQVSLPPSATLVSTSVEPAANYDLDRQILEFRYEFVKDEVLEIVFRVASGG